MLTLWHAGREPAPSSRPTSLLQSLMARELHHAAPLQATAGMVRCACACVSSMPWHVSPMVQLLRCGKAHGLGTTEQLPAGSSSLSSNLVSCTAMSIVASSMRHVAMHGVVPPGWQPHSSC